MDENNPHRPGHEETDVNVIAVGKVAIALLLVTIAAMGLLVGVFNFLKFQEGGEAKTVLPRTVFPQPQLEEKPVVELKDVLDAENRLLNTYGWVDKANGVVHIPIAQAMDQLVRKGLPVRAAAPPIEEGVSEPTESGLGPKMLPVGGPLGVSK